MCDEEITNNFFASLFMKKEKFKFFGEVVE